MSVVSVMDNFGRALTLRQYLPLMLFTENPTGTDRLGLILVFTVSVNSTATKHSQPFVPRSKRRNQVTVALKLKVVNTIENGKEAITVLVDAP